MCVFAYVAAGLANNSVQLALFVASFGWDPLRTTGLAPRALEVGRGVNDYR